MIRKQDRTQKERPKTSRLPLWLLLGAATAVMVLPLCLIVALHLPQLQELVIARLVQQIEMATPFKVQIEGYRWWPFSRLKLLNLRVDSSGSEILQCDQAQLAYRLSMDWPFVIPEELSLQKPVLRLEKDKKGNWQIPRTGSEKSGASQMDAASWLAFPWPQVRIDSGTITARQEGLTILTIRNVSGKLAVHPVSSPEGPRLQIEGLQWQGHFEDPPWGAVQMDGKAALDSKTLSLFFVNFALGEKGIVSCHGLLGSAPPFEGELTVDLTDLTPGFFSENPPILSAIGDVSGCLRFTRLPGGDWTVDHELRSNVGELDGSLTAEVGPQGDRILRWFTRFSNLGLSVFPQMPEPQLSGQIDLTVWGDGPETLRAQMKGSLNPSRLGEQAIRKGDLVAFYQDGALTVKATGIQSSVGDFSVSVDADLQGLRSPTHEGDLKADFRLDRVDLGKVLAGNQQRVGGSVQLEAHYLPGDFLNWRKWQGKMDANLFIPGLISLKTVGTTQNESMESTYTLEATDLQKISQFLPGWQGKGRLASQGSVKGRWPDLFWEGVIQSPRLEYGPVQGEQVALAGKGKLTGKEEHREGTLKVRNLEVSGKRIGSFDLEIKQEEGACVFQMKAEQLLQQVSARLAGRVERIWETQRSLVLSQGQYSWRDHTGTLEGNLSMEADRLKVHSLRLLDGRQKAQIQGELAWDGKSDLRLSLEEVSLGQWLRTFGGQEVMSGMASGQVHLTGSAEGPEVQINLQLTEGVLTAGLDSRSQGSPSSGKGKEIGSRSQESQSESGPKASGENSPTTGRTKGKTLPTPKAILAKLKAKVDRKPQQTREPETKAKGPELPPTAPTAKESFERIQVQGNYSKDVLQVQGEILSSMAESPVRCSARFPLHFSLKPFKAEVKQTDELSSTIKVAGLRVEKLLPYLKFLNKAGGRMDADVAVSGTLGQPMVRGSGVWRDGNFSVNGWPHPIENIQAEWQADSRDLFIRKAGMQHLGGKVELTGKVDYPRFRVLEMEAVGHDLEIPEFWGIKGRGACTAKLTQTPESALLKADVRLAKAQMNLRDLETGLARTIQIVGGDDRGDVLVVGGAEKAQSSYYDKLGMDLDVHLPASGTWVRGNGLEAEIKGDLRLTKTAFSPIKLHGGFQTLRGEYAFQGNKLKIVDGEIAFWGSPQPDPVLKIVCEKDIRDVTVRAQVSGPLSKPKLSLSSMPVMNQVDILSYLLFGHPAGELNSRQTSQLQDGAASVLGSEASRVLKGMFGNTPLAPDKVEYRKTGSKGENAVLEIGKYVTPDLYVTYGKGVKGEKDENQVQLEYRLNRHISIQTQIGGAEQSGVDVFWRYDFGK